MHLERKWIAKIEQNHLIHRCTCPACGGIRGFNVGPLAGFCPFSVTLSDSPQKAHLLWLERDTEEQEVVQLVLQHNSHGLAAKSILTEEVRAGFGEGRSHGRLDCLLPAARLKALVLRSLHGTT